MEPDQLGNSLERLGEMGAEFLTPLRDSSLTLLKDKTKSNEPQIRDDRLKQSHRRRNVGAAFSPLAKMSTEE